MADAPVAKAGPGPVIVFKQRPGELYHFAYGSNMNVEQIRKRCSVPRAVAVAKLADHRVAFFGYSGVWDGAMETVIAAPGREVWGVVYALNFADRESLDAWQDVRIDGTGAYFHYPAEVTDTKGRVHSVLFYKKDILGDPQKPSREYLDFIVQGAIEHGLPAAYIEGLRQIESKKADYKVPRYKTSGLGFILNTDCSGCGA